MAVDDCIRRAEFQNFRQDTTSELQRHEDMICEITEQVKPIAEYVNASLKNDVRSWDVKKIFIAMLATVAGGLTINAVLTIISIVK